MKFRILSFAVAIIAVVNAPAWGQVFQQGSMKFRLAFLDTADRGNIDWIVADGEITNETPNEFRQFLSLNKIKHGTKIEVYFNSPGGNIIGGLKLGEIIREFALGTRVARSVPQGRVLLNGEKPESDEPGHSYSACAVAFLGGKWRIASDRSLGVHQHYLEEALSDPKALKFSAVDFSVQQMLSGLLADYVSRMGVDARFIVLASMTKPNEIYAFTSDEMKQFRITWKDLEYTDWSFELYKDGLIAVSKTLNGEKFATLFCRKDRILRVLVNMPVYSSSSASEIDEIIKGARVDIFGREIPSKDISGREENGRLIFDVRLPSFEKAIDNDPVRTPNYKFGGMGALGATRYFFYHEFPAKNFLSYSKIIGRNCI